MSFPTLRRLNALLNAFVNRPGKKWKLISESEAEPDAESESEEDEMRLKNATKRSTAPSTFVTLRSLTCAFAYLHIQAAAQGIGSVQKGAGHRRPRTGLTDPTPRCIVRDEHLFVPRSRLSELRNRATRKPRMVSDDEDYGDTPKPKPKPTPARNT